eukprot:Gb_26937 [translate_table: standard]
MERGCQFLDFGNHPICKSVYFSLELSRDSEIEAILAPLALPLHESYSNGPTLTFISISQFLQSRLPLLKNSKGEILELIFPLAEMADSLSSGRMVPSLFDTIDGLKRGPWSALYNQSALW